MNKQRIFTCHIEEGFISNHRIICPLVSVDNVTQHVTIKQ